MEFDDTPRGALQFDPDKYPHCALKAFNEFIIQYEFRYQAQYSYPPKQAIQNEVDVWKINNTPTEGDNANVAPTPSPAQLKTISDDWISKDKFRKLLGFFASIRMQQDWKAAKSQSATIANVSDMDIKFECFLLAMRDYYKPTENHIIRNYEFRQMIQKTGETFSAWCNRVEEAGKNCKFCDCNETSECNACQYAVRDQIVIGTISDNIREKAMLKDWNLENLRKKGMKCESAAAGEEKLSGNTINK